jgi:hypothetical protein
MSELANSLFERFALERFREKREDQINERFKEKRREKGDGRMERVDGRKQIADGRRKTADGRRETGDGRRETGDGRREKEGKNVELYRREKIIVNFKKSEPLVFLGAIER